MEFPNKKEGRTLKGSNSIIPKKKKKKEEEVHDRFIQI